MGILTYAEIKMSKDREMRHSNYKMKNFQESIPHIGLRMFQDEIILGANEKVIKESKHNNC